jgi:uncharacterized membrane protein
MIRIYATISILLPIFFLIGSLTLSRALRLPLLLVPLAVLIPYFLCTTGVHYALFDEPGSVMLSSSGAEYDELFISDQESYSAKWLKTNQNESIRIYSDVYGIQRLLSQGEISYPFYYGTNTFIYLEKTRGDAYIYLRRAEGGNPTGSKIYTNGESAVLIRLIAV